MKKYNIRVIIKAIISLSEKSYMNTKDYSKILKEIPYRLYRKILYEFQRRRDSGKSLIGFSEKS